MKTKTVVAHSVWNYLGITANWIYNQLICLKDFDPLILATKLSNLDTFPLSKVYCFRGSQKYEPLKIRIYRRLGLLERMWEYHDIGIIKRNGAKLLHAHFGNEGYKRISLSRRLDIPQITTFYGYDLNLPLQDPAWGKRYKELFSDGILFLAEGDHMKQCLVALGCPAEKVVVNHLGVDLEAIRFLPRRMGENGVVKILIAGTFKEKKGIPYALEAIGKLREQGHLLQVTLIGDSTGTSAQESEKKRIHDVLNRCHLTDTVRMLGFQAHDLLWQAMYDNHILLSPSVTAKSGDTEGGAPVMLIEALASGMPVVSTHHCDIPEVIEDGISGYLAPERDVDGLVDQLTYLINNTQKWPAIGKSGRERMEKEYCLQKQVGKMEAIYKAILSVSLGSRKMTHI